MSSVSSEVAKPTLPVPSTTVSAPVSFVTAVSAPVSSVLPVSSSVPSLSPLSVPVPSVSANVPVSSCSATSRDENVSMSPEPSVVGSPRTVSSADYKKLIRLVVPKVKLGSDFSTVKKQCLSLAKSHKLNVSAEECARIASSVCSGDDPPSLPDIFPEDYVLQVRSTLDKELSKVPAAEFIDISVFTSKFLSAHSVPSRFRTVIYGHVRSFINRTRKK